MTMLSDCVPPPQDFLNHLVHFYEIQSGGHAVEYNLEVIHFYPVALTIPKWRKFRLLRLMQNLC
jgi:hypothetical protein